MKKHNMTMAISAEKHFLVAGSIVMVLVTGAVIASSALTPAQADDLANTGPCAGQLVATYPMNENLGRIEVYYARVDGGTNCFKLIAGKTKGTSTLLKVEASVDGVENNSNLEEGMFKTFAGPINISGTKGRCISFGGQVQVGESNYQQRWNAKHCG